MKTNRVLATVGAAILTLLTWGAAHAGPSPEGPSGGAPLASAPPTEEPKPPLLGQLNLNTASEAELMRLPGVGPSKAAAIVAWRRVNGGFNRVEDLRRVKGFGRKTLNRLKANLTVSGTTSLYGSKARRARD